jgi:outer membrane biogenesis lipoprotein LolB
MNKVLPILAVLSLAACSAFGGRPIDGAKVQNIQQCKTTEQEVISWFGSPGRRGKSGAYRSLSWRYSGSDDYGKIEQQLIVFVDARNRVVSYAWNPASPEVEVIDNCQK